MDRSDFLMLAAHETESRAIRHSSIPFVDYKPPQDDKVRLAPPGSVTVYVGPKGSSTLAAIRRAASGKDGADVTVAERIHSDYKKRKLLSPFSVWRMLQAQPVFASVRYGGRSIIKNLAIPPGLDVIGVPSPYNGGKLVPNELTLVEHVKEGSPAALEAVAIRREPNLSAAERAAVDQVSESQVELNLAPNGSCCSSDTDFWVFVAVTITLTCGDPFPDLHIAEDELKRMTPNVAAIRLMDLRREAFGHQH